MKTNPNKNQKTASKIDEKRKDLLYIRDYGYTTNKNLPCQTW